MAAAAAKAAKGVLSRVRVSGAGPTAATNVPRRLLSSSGKRTFSSNINGNILHEDQHVEKLERDLFNHKVDVMNQLHEQNMEISKLQGECELTKAKL